MALSEDKKAKALNVVKDAITQFENQRQNIRDGWVKYDKAYRAMFDANIQAYKGGSQYTSPIIQNNVETIVGRLSEAVRIGDKSVDIVANPTKPDLATNTIKAAAYKQIAIAQTEQQAIDEKKIILQRMAAKYGTAIVKVPWINNKETVKTRQIVQDPVLDEFGNPVVDEMGNPVMDEPRVEEYDEEVTTYIGAGYDIVTDLEDVYLDMFIQKIEDQPIIVHKMLVDEDFIDDQVSEGNYFKDIAEKVKKNPSNSSNDDNGSSRAEEVLGQTRTTTDNDDVIKEFEIFEGWVTFEGKEMLITVSNNELLGMRDNPYWHQKKPFLAFKYMEVEGEFYGIGAIDPVINLWYDYNDTMNQMNDAASFVLNPIVVEFVANAKSKQNLKVTPGAIWSEKVAGSLRAFQQDVSSVLGGEQRLAAMEQRINNGMGITPLMQGTSDELDNTYRGTKMVITQGDKKHKQRAKSFEQSMYKEWLVMGFSMNSQLNDEKFLYVGDKIDPQTGQPVQIEISVQESIGEFTFNINGVEHFFDLEDRLEKTMLFSDRTVNRPWINSQFLDQQIAEMMGLKDIDQIIVEPPPPVKEPTKPPNVSISLNPKDGVGVAMTVAQLLEQAGYEIDINQAIDDAKIVTERTAPTALINSGMLPDSIEEDIVEDRGDSDIALDKKVNLVTGANPSKSVTKV